MKKIKYLVALLMLSPLVSCSNDDDNTTTTSDETTTSLYYQDLDGDGLGNQEISMESETVPEGYVLESGDFDDNNSAVQSIQDAALSLVTSLGGTDTYALETYVNQEIYIQHNQTFGDGVGTVLGAIQLGFLSGTTFTLSRTITDTNADGDTIVILHGIYGGTWNGGNPQVVFDIFRFDKDSGLVEEHWDNLISPTDPVTDALNGNTQLDGETIITNLDETETNKEIVQNYIADVLVGGSWVTAAPNYFNEAGDLIQHSPETPNGIGSFSLLGDDTQKYDDESPRFIYGEGNFVLTMSQGNEANEEFANIAYYDLFRLEDGKIVEHWDIEQDILALENSANTNGKW